MSKRVNAPYEPGQRTWLKVKCLNREEFIVVGWSDPEGTRHRRLGSLLLGYYTSDGKLTYAGRAGTGMSDNELERLWRKLQPLAIDKMPLAEPPPRSSRFGSPLVLSRVHWVRPEMVVEVSYLTWTEDGLLRQVVIGASGRISQRRRCSETLRNQGAHLTAPGMSTLTRPATSTRSGVHVRGTAKLVRFA
jgi:ATP-dependent DNA ligase